MTKRTEDNTHEDRTEDHPVPEWLDDYWWFRYTREDNFS